MAVNYDFFLPLYKLICFVNYHHTSTYTFTPAHHEAIFAACVSSIYEMLSYPWALCSGRTSRRPRGSSCSVSRPTCCTQGASQRTLWKVPRRRVRGERYNRRYFICRQTHVMDVNFFYPNVDHCISSITLQRVQLQVPLKVPGIKS